MASSSTIAIGNCSVEISGDIDYEKNGRRVSFSIPGLGTVRVSAAAPTSIVPLNPVALDTTGQQLLGDALDLYTGEFSTSCRAYISGCVKDGKNVTLVLAEHQHVVAAMTYQISFSDELCAVVLLSAVRSSHQRKGLGTRLCIEFQRRLCDIGVSTVYCFAGRDLNRWLMVARNQSFLNR
ncbi:uncharacterized protein LOC9659926 [Selaginella moellendorffii]|uniref:uncharacterized protein LOC9659926 n=1 Tax=Selaginella moellendorffii TaxID=88036 RepID=UPI000D1C634B|nr:uncharacterized protein LOC9659926 [Selaginella moellendorffii]|eukprot:XP_024525349.1 uncharacterized protein LOC9659926 [Selaginella moellendorffii]